MYTIPENSRNGSRKKLEIGHEIAYTKVFSVILRIPEFREGEMKVIPGFSGAKSVHSIQNDQKMHFLFLTDSRSPGSVGYFRLLIFTKSISFKTVAGGSHFFPYENVMFILIQSVPLGQNSDVSNRILF